MKKKTLIFIMVLVVLAAALAVGGFWLATRWNENKPYASYNLDEYIKLGEYKGLEPEFTQPDLSEDRIRELTKIYFTANGVSFLKEDPSKTAAQKGDLVRIGFEGEVPGISDEVRDGLRREKWELEIGKNTFVKGFDEHLIGREVSEEPFEFKLTFPADYFEPELAGKECTFKCVVQAIGTVDFNDERVKELQTPDGMGLFTELGELETYLKEEIVRKNKEVNNRAVLEAAFANAEVLQFPERELTYYMALFEEKAGAKGMTAEEYLASVGQKGGLAVYKEEVKAEVERELFLFAVAEKEGLKVSTQEFRNYMETLRGGDASITNVQIYEQYGSRGTIIRAITAGKTTSFLAEHAKGYPKQPES